MTKKMIICIISTFILLSAAGCVPQCADSELDTTYPSALDPNFGAIASSLTPTLKWDWQFSTCNPYQFNITLTDAATGSETSHSASGTAREYDLIDLLEEGSKYTWTLYGTTSGDYHTRTRTAEFYTGPLCSNITPVAPVLDFPADGEFVTPPTGSGDIKFQWQYPEPCLPHTFVYEVASDPGFVNIIASGETQDHKQEFELKFQDCSTAYWHIAAKNNNLQGPWSETRSFNYIIDPHCWMNHYPSDEVAQIRGRVYLDQCSQTAQLLQNASASGCINSPWGIMGDTVMSSNPPYWWGPEKGLSNVVVDLGSGPCPSTGLDHTTTGVHGKYRFTVMTPGEYCVSVSKDQTGYKNNKAYNMMNGLWSNPPAKSLRVGYDLYLSPGWYDLEHNFGWDKYDQFLKPFFREPTWCRWRPYPICDPLHLFEIGDMAPMLARNEEGTWVMTSIQGQTCYFYHAPELEDLTAMDTGIPVELYMRKFDGLEVYPAPPPCPPPPPEPKPKKPSVPDDSCAGKSEPNCFADANCKWVFSDTGAGICKTK